jgi:methylphosphotriester-DNA--protein-cysteine methyltransferase
MHQAAEGAGAATPSAAVARLSPDHFARQFKAATGLPPHQFVIARRGFAQKDENP